MTLPIVLPAIPVAEKMKFIGFCIEKVKRKKSLFRFQIQITKKLEAIAEDNLLANLESRLKYTQLLTIEEAEKERQSGSQSSLQTELVFCSPFIRTSCVQTFKEFSIVNLCIQLNHSVCASINDTLRIIYSLNTVSTW